jgi:hypothetical protein
LKAAREQQQLEQTSQSGDNPVRHGFWWSPRTLVQLGRV